MPFLLGHTGESEGSARKESKSRDVRRSAPFGGSGIMATKKIKKTGALIATYLASVCPSFSVSLF